jgi:hypothetical protein
MSLRKNRNIDPRAFCYRFYSYPTFERLLYRMITEPKREVARPVSNA